MGQKVNPHGLRVGVIKDWDSKWYAEGDFADNLVEDYNIRTYLKKKLYSAGVSKIEIERASDRVKVIIYTAKPGVVIGKGGAEIEKVKGELAQFTDKKLIVDIKEIKRPDKDAQLVAENIALQLENRISFRRAMKSCMSRTAGSNATTMLCMDTQSTFYRKYAFGKDGAKLAEQLDWLRAQQDRLPLCDILRSEEADGCCWYDMVYNPQAVGMFRYLHSNPVEKSRAILRAVLATLEDKLYKPTAVPADAEKIEKYIETKVDGNLKKLHEDRMLRELMSYDTLRINGVEYKNLPALDWMFDHDRLRNLFAKDPVGTIHGDLTIENIICRTDNDSWYLIDPNTGNLHESPFLDYGKLLQSLHGSYEFMMKTPRVAVQDNRIDFQLTRSAAYDALLAAVMEDLSARYPREQVESILMHEVIHWLRLMPYKLNKDRKRAAMFYAGLVMVANDVANFSEHKKETLC